MTKEEAKAYALKIAQESGVAPEVATQIASAFDNDKFFNGFVPRPEVDRSLNSERQRYNEFKTRNEYLEQQWYPEAKRVREQAEGVLSRLTKYQQLYGEIDESDPNAVRRAANATGLSKEDVQAMLTEHLSTALSSRDAATLDLLDIREEHLERFKKRIPMNEFEGYVAQQRKAGRNDSLRSLYKDWVQPELEKVNEASIEARLKAAREEGAKDFASRHKLPVDSKPREAHLLFDRKGEDGKPETSRSGRDAFLEVLNDPDPDTVRARFPVS